MNKLDQKIEKTLIDLGANEMEEVVDYYGPDNPRSIVNIVPKSFQDMIARRDVQELVDMDEHKLFKKVNPTVTLNRLRKSFWMEYNRAQTDRNEIVLARVYSGICTERGFAKLMKIPAKISWVLNPPKEYVESLEEGLDIFAQRIKEILTLPLTSVKAYKTRTGKTAYQKVPNATAVNAILKVGKMLDERLHGGIVQKIHHRVDQRNLNMNMDAGSTPAHSPKQLIEPPAEVKTLEQLDEEILSLQKEMDGQQTNGDGGVARAEVIEVEATQVETTSGAEGDGRASKA